VSGCLAESDSLDTTADEEIGASQEALSASGFMLHNTNTGKCISAPGSVGADATLAVCDSSSANQRWGFDGGWLKHSASGLCLDLEGASQSNGAPAQVFTCRGGTNQDFRFYPTLSHAGTTVTNWYLIVKHSGKCLEPGGAASAQVVQSSNCLAAWNVMF
jgi:hypothetical protein